MTKTVGSDEERKRGVAWCGVKGGGQCGEAREMGTVGIFVCAQCWGAGRSWGYRRGVNRACVRCQEGYEGGERCGF